MSKVFATMALVISAVLIGTSITKDSQALPDPSVLQVDVKKVNVNQVAKDIKCMADNIYHEARNQSKEGMIAVGRVVINRVKSPMWPNTICGVIYDAIYTESWRTKEVADATPEMIPVRNKCQFSWYCDGKTDDVNDLRAYQQAKEIATDIVVNNRWDGIVHGATFYHANYVNPRWSSQLAFIGRIDTHLFYKHH